MVGPVNERHVPIGDERFVGTETVAVRSPYDGAELARVPACTPADVDRAVKAAVAARTGRPLPPWRRAETLDAAARLLRGRPEDFARPPPAEAGQPHL